MAKMIIEFGLCGNWDDFTMYFLDADGAKWKRIGKCNACGECCRKLWNCDRVTPCDKLDRVSSLCQMDKFKKPFNCWVYPESPDVMLPGCGFSWEKVDG
jgi:hypothetical protein